MLAHKKRKVYNSRRGKENMVVTVHCANRRCESYKKPVKYTFVYLRRSKACVVCGSLMVDGERSNDGFKNGRKRVGRKRLGRTLVVRGDYRRASSKKKRKSPARKRTSYKR
jgi:hypothetical protein